MSARRVLPLRRAPAGDRSPVQTTVEPTYAERSLPYAPRHETPAEIVRGTPLTGARERLRGEV